MAIRQMPLSMASKPVAFMMRSYLQMTLDRPIALLHILRTHKGAIPAIAVGRAVVNGAWQPQAAVLPFRHSICPSYLTALTFSDFRRCSGSRLSGYHLVSWICVQLGYIPRMALFLFSKDA